VHLTSKPGCCIQAAPVLDAIANSLAKNSWAVCDNYVPIDQVRGVARFHGSYGLTHKASSLLDGLCGYLEHRPPLAAAVLVPHRGAAAMRKLADPRHSRALHAVGMTTLADWEYGVQSFHTSSHCCSK